MAIQTLHAQHRCPGANSDSLFREGLSSHLACLADCGYITARRDGRWCYYRVTDPRVADLVVLARSLAADSCTALDACELLIPCDIKRR